MNELYLAGGCFWGVEELFRHQPGVVDTEVGYMGGEHENPTYDNHDGHAETVKITYDADKTSQSALFDYFFQIHDPTTVNRQGYDIGSSYRSAIFYATTQQKADAEEAIRRNQQYWQAPIVTQLQSMATFWPAEIIHQNFLQTFPGGYTCHYERQR